MNYYIWHDEGCCDNKTDDIAEARRIRNEFRAKGLDSYITDSDNSLIEDPVRVKLTLDISYALNGESPVEMTSRLRMLFERAFGEGLLTGETDAEVDEHKLTITVLPDTLPEQPLRDLFLQRIECGDLCIEDVPDRMVRYGLMDPQSLLDEMHERMSNL